MEANPESYTHINIIKLQKPRKVHVLSNPWSEKSPPYDLTRGIPKHLFLIILVAWNLRKP